MKLLCKLDNLCSCLSIGLHNPAVIIYIILTACDGKHQKILSIFIHNIRHAYVRLNSIILIRKRRYLVIGHQPLAIHASDLV